MLNGGVFKHVNMQNLWPQPPIKYRKLRKPTGKKLRKLGKLINMTELGSTCFRCFLSFFQVTPVFMVLSFLQQVISFFFQFSIYHEGWQPLIDAPVTFLSIDTFEPIGSEFFPWGGGGVMNHFTSLHIKRVYTS